MPTVKVAATLPRRAYTLCPGRLTIMHRPCPCRVSIPKKTSHGGFSMASMTCPPYGLITMSARLGAMVGSEIFGLTNRGCCVICIDSPEFVMSRMALREMWCCVHDGQSLNVSPKGRPLPVLRQIVSWLPIHGTFPNTSHKSGCAK